MAPAVHEQWRRCHGWLARTSDLSNSDRTKAVSTSNANFLRELPNPAEYELLACVPEVHLARRAQFGEMLEFDRQTTDADGVLRTSPRGWSQLQDRIHQAHLVAGRYVRHVTDTRIVHSATSEPVDAERLHKGERYSQRLVDTCGVYANSEGASTIVAL